MTGGVFGPVPDSESSPVTIGIDIGGTSVRAGVVDAQCRILDSRRAPTPPTVAGIETLFQRMIGELAAGRPANPVRAVGLAVAGFVSADQSSVMFAPHLAWRGEPVPARIAELVGLPVVMDHDVNSAAWAEFRYGSARGSSPALLVALGTGIGAGLVVDGRIYRGAHGVAPELGHLELVSGGRPCPCGKRGCWERYCSGTALVAAAGQRLADGQPSALTDLAPAELTGAAVAAAAATGDRVALACLHELGELLGRGLAIAVDVLDPDVIVIGGGVVDSADYFLPQALTLMAAGATGAAHRVLPAVRPATFGSRAGIIGAALLAAESVVAAATPAGRIGGGVDAPDRASGSGEPAGGSGTGAPATFGATEMLRA